MTMSETQSNHQIVDYRHILPSLPHGETGGVFVQRYIPTIMQPAFNAPITAQQADQFSG